MGSDPAHQETNDYVGLAVHCAAGDNFCASAEAVKYGQSSPSPTAVTDETTWTVPTWAGSVLPTCTSGRFGRRCLTYLAFYQIMLPVIAPAVDLAAIYGILFLNPVEITVFWLAFNAFQLLACGYALRLDRERLRALWALPLQQVVYRQLMYLVTIQSVMTALLGTRHRWQAMNRTGIFAGGTGHTAGPSPTPAVPR